VLIRFDRLIVRTVLVALLLGGFGTATHAQGAGGVGRAERTIAIHVDSVAVPVVIGLRLSKAEEIVHSGKLDVAAKNLAGTAPAPTDSVVRQTPPKGKVPVGSTVTLYVVTVPSAPPPKATTPKLTPPKAPPPKATTPKATTPSVIGRSMADAKKIIARAKLTPSTVTWEPSRDTALGSVTKQSPNPNAPVPADRRIALTFAGVPNVVKLSPAMADAVLRRAHLRVGSVTAKDVASGDTNTVLDQAPTAGQEATPGSAVNLIVARGKATAPTPPVGFAMPNLVGRSISDAEKMVAESSLTISAIAISNTVERPDTVVGQHPDSGAMVHRGDGVTLVRGHPITTVVVPNIVRLRTGAARNILAVYGLTLNPVRAQKSNSIAGTVLSQNPDSGARVPRGTSVVVDTAIPPPELPADIAAPETPGADAGQQPVAPTVPVLTIARLAVVPESTSAGYGKTVLMAAVAHMSDGSQHPVAVTWTSNSGKISTTGVFVAGNSTARVIVTAALNGQSGTAIIRVDGPSFAWWLLVPMVVGLAALVWLGRIAWLHLHPPTPPSPPAPPIPPLLAFTYDYKRIDADTTIVTTGGHGPDLALISHMGESQHAVAPPGVTLYDEDRFHE
jgi:beta-lactam-binding protein with PASTA domain